MSLLVPVLLVFSALSLALGIVLPLVMFEKLYFFSETPSLVDIIASLWAQQNRMLAGVVALFSIVFPMVKLVAVAFEATTPRGDAARERMLSRLLPLLARWSMMDVMLVALVIFATKTSGMAEAFTQPGLWFYAGSAVLTGILQMRLRPH